MPMSPRLLRPVAGGTFSPKSLSGLAGWWDAADASTVSLSGSAVTQWNDKSGVGNHVAGVSSNEPTYGASALNGKGGMLWGSTQGTAKGFRRESSIAAYTAKDIYVVLRWGAGATSTEYAAITVTNNILGLENSGTIFYNVGWSRFSINGASSSTTALPALAAPSVLRGTLTTAQANQNIYFGKWGGFTTRGWAGDIYEVIFYNRELSASEDAKVRNYLARKWGLYPYSPPAYADADVNAYINAVEAADKNHLETGVRDAINTFITGCKSDGIWSAIKASCILMGARTLAGALVPLKGPSPTNVNFVSGDYSRKLGLKGNESNKYLDSGYLGDADPQDNHHIAVLATQVMSGGSGGLRSLIGVGNNANGSSNLLARNSDGLGAFRNQSASSTTLPNCQNTAKFQGASRSASADFDIRGNSSTVPAGSIASQTPISANVYVFGNNVSGSVNSPTGQGLGFYSIGESLNLASLQTRADALLAAIGAAI